MVALLLHDGGINNIIDGNVQVLFQNKNIETVAGPVIGSS